MALISKRERAASHTVGSAALDERDVRDDRAAVPETFEQHGDHAHPHVRRRGGAGGSDGDDADETHVGRADIALDQPGRHKAAEDQPKPGARPEQAEAEVTGVVGHPGKEDLRDVHGAVGES